MLLEDDDAALVLAARVHVHLLRLLIANDKADHV
jgi:hypothetical protein